METEKIFDLTGKHHKITVTDGETRIRLAVSRDDIIHNFPE